MTLPSLLLSLEDLEGKLSYQTESENLYTYSFFKVRNPVRIWFVVNLANANKYYVSIFPPRVHGTHWTQSHP